MVPKIDDRIHWDIRPLAEPVYDEKFLGESQMSTAEYSNVFEERNQVSTTKLPSETELCKKSIVDCLGKSRKFDRPEEHIIGQILQAEFTINEESDKQHDSTPTRLRFLCLEKIITEPIILN